MSQWTHVSGVFRIDAIPQMGITPNIPAIFGTPSNNPFDLDAEYREGSNIPGGSEGTIQYAVNDAGDGMVWKTVAVWGDLRDFGSDDCAEIDAWFERIAADARKGALATSRLMLRDAHLLVRVEYGASYLLYLGDENEVRRLELPATSTEAA